MRPIMNTIDAVTRAISEYLNELIQPIYNENTKDSTCIDSVDLIKRLQTYTDNGHLQSTTLFGVSDVKNLYTMIPQDGSLVVLDKFLRTYRGEYVNNLSVTTILILAEIVLKENAFVCNNKFYKQVIGGAMGSPFTLTLANIFMWDWEQQWIQRQEHHGELYVRYVFFFFFIPKIFSYNNRYIDDIFFTSNESIEKIQELLQAANTWRPNIKLKTTIGTSVPFLDLLISNHQGILHTAVYRKPSAEPYVVPFLSDHPRHIFPNIIQIALIRAIRYSSTIDTYTNEQITIELMLLYNGSVILNTIQSYLP